MSNAYKSTFGPLPPERRELLRLRAYAMPQASYASEDILALLAYAVPTGLAAYDTLRKDLALAETYIEGMKKKLAACEAALEKAHSAGYTA